MTGDPENWAYPGLAVIFGMFLVFPLTGLVFIFLKTGLHVWFSSPRGLTGFRLDAFWVFAHSLGWAVAVTTSLLLPSGRIDSLVLGRPASFAGPLWPYLFLLGPFLAVGLITVVEVVLLAMRCPKPPSRLALSVSCLLVNSLAFFCAIATGVGLAMARYVRWG